MNARQMDEQILKQVMKKEEPIRSLRLRALPELPKLHFNYKFDRNIFSEISLYPACIYSL